MKSLQESLFDKNLANKRFTIGSEYEFVDIRSHHPQVIHQYLDYNKLKSSGYKPVSLLQNKLLTRSEGYLITIIYDIPIQELKKPKRKRPWFAEWNEMYSMCDNLDKYLRKYIDDDVTSPHYDADDIKFVIFEPDMDGEHIVFQIFSPDGAYITWYFKHK